MGDFNLSPINVTCDLTPLVKSIPNSVSKIFDLVFGKMVAKTEATKKLIDAQTERHTRLILDGKACLDVNNKLINFEQVKSDNAQQCLEYAVREALLKEGEPSDDEVSRTFFNKWREQAQYIDEDSLKEFWARILVEEIYKPNTINLRALNTLSMISSDDARRFNETMKYIIFDKYLAIDFIPLENKQSTIEFLYDIGVISSIPKSGLRLGTQIWRFKKDSHNYHFFYQQNNNFCITLNVEDFTDNNNDGLSLELLELTIIGKTLYKLAISIDENLSINLAKMINRDMLDKIDKEESSKITSINVYRLENQTVTDSLFSKNFT